MPIDFEIPDFITNQLQLVQYIADNHMRPYSREMDEHEHLRPTAFIEQMWPLMKEQQKLTLRHLTEQPKSENGDKKRPSTAFLRLMLLVEMLSWGDAGI